MKFSSLRPGGRYYIVERRRMGTMSCDVVYDVIVRSVDEQTLKAVVSWNGSRDETWSWATGQLKRLRLHPPEWVRNELDGGPDGARCHVCDGHKRDGHRETCTHPRARKRAAKAVTP